MIYAVNYSLVSKWYNGEHGADTKEQKSGY
jgi:hypothetical protein